MLVEQLFQPRGRDLDAGADDTHSPPRYEERADDDHTQDDHEEEQRRSDGEEDQGEDFEQVCSHCVLL